MLFAQHLMNGGDARNLSWRQGWEYLLGALGERQLHSDYRIGHCGPFLPFTFRSTRIN